MITDADIKKMKKVFATKEDLKALEAKMATKEELRTLEVKMATKEDFKQLSNKFETEFATKNEMYSGFQELLKFIGETKEDIVSLLSKQINDFRDEMRDINRSNQSVLNNHETKITHLEYNKS